jgi:Fe-S-cluster containining protein
MTATFDMKKYADHVQSLAMERLSSATTSADLVAMMKQIVEGAETALDANREGGEHLACKAGCGACCVLNVAVLFPEVVAIVDFLQTQLDPEQLRMLSRRLNLMADKVRGLGEEEWIALRESCAFLDASENCSIYPVRPLICRSITSTNASHCEEALKIVSTGMERPIFMNMFQKSLMEKTFIALAQGATQLGFDDHSEQLTVAVQQFLERPQQTDCFLTRQSVWSDYLED